MAAITLAGLLAPAAHAAKRGNGIRVGIVTAKQSEALRRGSLRVKVRVRRTMRVRLFATLGGGIVGTGVRELRMRRGRSRVVRLRLTNAGRRTMRSTCGRVAVSVLGARARTARTGPGPATRRTRRLRKARCTPRPRAVAHSTPANAARCDFLDPAVCLQPWPNNHFTRRDGSTATKRRLDLKAESMPKNRAGKPIAPIDYNRNDGFSPGSTLITKVPRLHSREALRRSRVVPVTDMARAYDRRQPVVVINARTRARHLVWAEVDANASDPEDVNLIIRPGRNFREGNRYVVALRFLRDASGKRISPGRDFRLLRDRIISKNGDIESRRAHMESMFRTLAHAGVSRDSLYRVWDFTVASRRNLTERVLAMRDDAYKRLGDTNLRDLKPTGRSPQFRVTRTEENPNERLARIVEGTVTVPCYLDQPGCPPGSRFLHAPGSTQGKPILQPIPGNTTQAKFRCIVPKVAAGGGARPSLYGHGLFGSRGEVEQGQLQDLAQEHNFVFCATEWVGMACADLTDPTDPAGILEDSLAGNPPTAPNCDIPNVATILTDLSRFPTLADRVQQGMVNFTYLGRAMLRGFNSHPAFRLGGRGVMDTRRLFYDGNSQGGIIGGALIAIEPDLNRGVLGVPGMNYSTLLTRSRDFGTGRAPAPNEPIPEYAYPLYQSYPDEIERPLIFALIQTLWDRAEANGYAQHMTNDPLPNTPRHRVLMHGGLGDWQVAQLAAETEARTIGASTHRPYTDRGRNFDVRPAYGLPGMKRFPFSGSALIMWDPGPPRKEGDDYTGTTPPPTTNTVPPTEPPDHEQQEDPHELPRRSAQARRQKSAFLKIGGRIVNVCGKRPCYAGTWKGP